MKDAGLYSIRFSFGTALWGLAASIKLLLFTRNRQTMSSEILPQKTGAWLVQPMKPTG